MSNTMDVLRQIVQSQMSTTPFRHKPSPKRILYHSKLLSQLKFDGDSISDMKEESDDDDDDDDDDKEKEWEKEMFYDDCMEIINLEPECNELYDILYSTILGKGNTSILLIGRHGHGKSSLLSVVMQRIEKKCGKNAFIYIYLNGYVQNTDIEALFEVVSQLALQNGKKFDFSLHDDDDDDDDANDSESDSDEDIDMESGIGKLKKSGFVDNLEFLVHELKKVTMDNYDIKNRHKKPIYIVLDNFELFAKRRKQTLLYNLFDLNQSESSLINIIGITKKKSVYELLEKRIRSRFVHEKIFVPQKAFLSDNSFKLYYKIMYNAFIIHDYKKYFEKHNQSKHKHIEKLIKKYNYWIAEQILEKKMFEECIHKFHKYGYEPGRLMIICGLISSIIFDKKYFLKNLNNSIIKFIISEIETELFEDPFLRMVSDLNSNELILLIIASKLDITHNEKFNFEIIYQTLLTVQKQDSMMIEAGKLHYFQSYRHLIDLRFLVCVTNTNKINISSCSDILYKVFHRRYDMVRLNKLISGDVILRYISQNVKHLPSWIHSWLLDNKTQICL